MQLNEVAKPGLMISNVDPESRKVPGQTLSVLREAQKLGFFEAYQTVEVPWPEERSAIAEQVRAQGLDMTYCLTRVLNENGWDLSSVDEDWRSKSVQAALTYLDSACEQAANTVHLISGPADADEDTRQQQLTQLQRSLQQICKAAAAKQLKVVIEPLDVGAHKKKALGTTGETVKMIRAIRRHEENIYLCLDTSHLLLNGEQIKGSLNLAKEYVDELHFCNPVLNEKSELFGDRHVRFGPPGEIDLPQIVEVLVYGYEIGLFDQNNRTKMFCEVIDQSQDVPALIKYCRDILVEAWHCAEKKISA